MAPADLSAGKSTQDFGSGELTIDDLIQGEDYGLQKEEGAQAEVQDPELELALSGLTAGRNFVEKTLDMLFHEFLMKRGERGKTTLPLRIELLEDCAKAFASRYENLMNVGLSERQILKNSKLLLRSTDQIYDSLEKLAGFGLNEKTILSQAGLLAVPSEMLQNRRDRLEKIGIRGKGCSYAKLLLMPPEEFMARYRSMRRAGMSLKTISSNYQVFHMRAETIRYKNGVLKELGLDPGRPLYGRILGRKLETIIENYGNLLTNVGLDRERITASYGLLLPSKERVNERHAYLEARFGSDGETDLKKEMSANPELLLTPVATMEANEAFWKSLNPAVRIKPYMLLGSVEKKKRNAAWVRRRLFSYSGA